MQFILRYTFIITNDYSTVKALEASSSIVKY